METIDAAKLRSEFLQVLRSRRSSEVTLSVELAKPVADPMYRQTPLPSFSEAMESCPKADIPNLKDLLKEENVYLITEVCGFLNLGHICLLLELASFFSF
ncbi:hypothetical protein CsSME_00044127 [Camellia sinensis var. sinensis]